MTALADFRRDRDSGVRVPPDAGAPAGYLDGAEQRLLQLLRNARDRSVGSAELQRHMRDWPSLYHLTPYRTTLLDALGFTGAGDKRVLELGAGCGAITRWLGEHFGAVHAVEGDRMRASVARARTADLRNVDLFAANYSELDEPGGYDLVTLIGVLEYGHLYHPDTSDPDAAALANLRVARTALGEGALVLAIENRLGLKYLNGAREDHSGRRHESVEGYPHAKSAVTFSRRKLLDLLAAAGFGDVATYLPFPDYKLASTVIAADEVEAADRVHNWLPHTAPDRGHPRREVHYHESLALREIAEAGLLPDLSNSLLLVAYAGDRAAVDARLGIETGWKVRHYSLARTRTTAKRVTITDARTPVRNEPAFGGDGGTTDHGLLRHTLADEPWAPGELLVFDVHEAVAGDRAGASLTEIVARHEDWLIERLGTGRRDGDGYALLDGAAFDATWWNVVCDEQGTRRLIDREWTCSLPLPVDAITYRSARHYGARWGAHLPAPWTGDAEGFAADIVRRRHPDVTVHRLRHLRRIVDRLDGDAAGLPAAADDTTAELLGDPAAVRNVGLDARGFVVLADADAVVADPALATAFADAFDARSDATLVLCADGWDSDRMAAELAPVLAATGLDGAQSADVLAVPAPAAAFGEDAHAVLTSGAGVDGLPRVRPGGTQMLRELERQHRLRARTPTPA